MISASELDRPDHDRRVRLYNFSMGVAKVSVERDFLVLRVYNWGWITVRYTE